MTTPTILVGNTEAQYLHIMFTSLLVFYSSPDCHTLNLASSDCKCLSHYPLLLVSRSSGLRVQVTLQLPRTSLYFLFSYPFYI